MINKMLRTLFLMTLLVGGLTAAAGSGPDAKIHFALSKSAPAADATLETVTEIRLWFTEAPSEGTTAIRLIGADEEPIHTGEVTQDPEDDRAFFVELHGALAPGSYSVAWRGMGADGHAVRETFAFAVKAK